MEQRVNKDIIKTFDFILDDGDQISIDGNFIKSFGLFGITWNAQREAPDQDIAVYATVSKYNFRIDNAADPDKTIIQKLSFGNIAAIILTYTSEKIDKYYIRWDSDDTVFDKWQICEATDDLFILRRR